MVLKFDFSYCDKAILGSNGVDLNDYDCNAVDLALKKVMENAGKADMKWVNPIEDDELARIVYLSNKIKKADSFVLCGIGGSALGSLCCASALINPNHNELSKKKRKFPKFYVEDNIDGQKLSALLHSIDLKNSYFNFVTKSGVTTETIAQFLIIYDLLKQKLGKKANERIIITTTLGKSELYQFAIANGIEVFSVPNGVGGRFSVFSQVGLIPLAVLGLDIKAFILGAKKSLELSLNRNLKQNPALVASYIMFDQLKRGKNISVIMPYSSLLKYVGDFYCQLWGESLGKAYNFEGNLINAGQTPLKVLGSTDQHSLLQLFCEGPNDKIITFIKVEDSKAQLKIPSLNALKGFNFLKGKEINSLLNASLDATAFNLAKNSRLSFTITMPYICEYTLGQLLGFFMFETVFMAYLMQVNPFDQPAVEAIKKTTASLISNDNLILEQLRQFNFGGLSI